MGRDDRDIRAGESVEVDVVRKVPDRRALGLDEENIVVRNNRRHVIGTDERLRIRDDRRRGDSRTRGPTVDKPRGLIRQHKHTRGTTDDGLDCVQGVGDKGPGDRVIGLGRIRYVEVEILPRPREVEGLRGTGCARKSHTLLDECWDGWIAIGCGREVRGGGSRTSREDHRGRDGEASAGASDNHRPNAPRSGHGCTRAASGCGGLGHRVRRG